MNWQCKDYQKYCCYQSTFRAVVKELASIGYTCLICNRWGREGTELTICTCSVVLIADWKHFGPLDELEVMMFIAVQATGDFSIAGGLHFAEINCSWDGTKTSMDCI